MLLIYLFQRKKTGSRYEANSDIADSKKAGCYFTLNYEPAYLNLQKSRGRSTQPCKNKASSNKPKL